MHLNTHTNQLGKNNSNRLKIQFLIAEKLINTFGISGEDYVRDYSMLFARLWDMGLKGIEIEKILISKCCLEKVTNSNKNHVGKILDN